MNRINNGAVQPASNPGVAPAEDSFGDVGSIAPRPRKRDVMRSDLQPWQQEASLTPGAGSGTSSPTLAPLTRYIGAALTVANPAWARNPLPALRALQKKIIEHSLTLDTGERADSMAAINVVESAVQLRLRFQQMDMQDWDGEEGGEAQAAAPAARSAAR